MPARLHLLLGPICVLAPLSASVHPALGHLGQPGPRSTLSTMRDPVAYAGSLRAPVVYGRVPLTRREAVVEHTLAHARDLAGAQAVATAERLNDEAERTGLDPWLLVALIEVESSFRHLALSRVGAEGLMQLMPETSAFLAARGSIVRTEAHAFDPLLNVTLGVQYLAELHRLFDGRLDQVLTAYNRGPAATRACLRARGALPSEVRAAYSDRVLTQYRALQQRHANLPRHG